MRWLKWKGTVPIDYESLCCERSGAVRQLELLALLKARPDLKGIWEDEIIPPPPAPPATLHLFAFFFPDK